ncbi:MAG: PAS domain S-box protein [Cyanobacteria bacterium SID2]|nr:PAS domain S-box protein [Cyanobacteria bacterium SID2]
MSFHLDRSDVVEESLEFSEILDILGVQIWHLRDPETYGSIERAAADFLGLPQVDVQNRKLSDVLPPALAKTCIASNREVFETGQRSKLEVSIENSARETRSISITKIPKFDRDGIVTSVVCIGIDITEQQRVQQELAQSRERLELAMDATEHGFWDWDLETDCVYFSPRWYTMLGYEPGELPMTFKTWKTLLHPDDRIRVMPLVRAAVDRSSLFEVEFRLKCKDETWRWIRGKGKGYQKDATGSHRRIIGTHEDIHDLKQTEALLRIQRDIALSLSSTSDLERAIEQLLDRILAIDGLDCGGVYLLNEQTGYFELVAHRNFSPIFVQHVRQLDPESHRGRWLKAGTPIYQSTRDLAEIERDAVFQREGLQAISIVPIRSSASDRCSGATIAALNLGSHSSGEIPDNLRQTLESIATRIGETIVRLKMEAALQESRENLQTLFDTMADLVFVVDECGQILNVNPAVERRLGYSREELLTMSVLDLHPPHQRQTTLEMLAEIVAGTCDCCPLPLRAKDGTFVSTETKIERGRWSDRNVLFGISRDMTERKKAEDALLEERRLFMAGPTVVFKWQAREGWPVEYVSQNLFEQLGYLAEDFMMQRRHFSELFHPEDRERVFRKAEAHLQAGDPCFEQEYRLRHARGTYLWVYDFTTVVRQSDGTVTHFLGYIQNISDRKQAEADLHASKARWQFALEGAGDGVWDWNVQTNEVFFSHQWKAMLGYDEDDIRPHYQEWAARVHPDDLHRCEAALDRHLRGETPCYQAEHRLRCKDGRYKWILDRGKVIEWTKDGQPLRAIGTHADISDRRQAEATLRETNQQLQAFLDNSPAPVSVFDGTGRYLRVNRALSRLLGRPEAEIVGCRFDAVLPANVAMDFETRVRQLAATGVPLIVEDRWRVDGRDLVFQSVWFLVRKNGRDAETFGAISTDLTGRVEAETALQVRYRHERGLELCSQALLEGGEGALDRALLHLQSIAEVDRVYLFENFDDPSKGLCMRQTHEVVAPGIPSQLNNPKLQNLSYREIQFEAWMEKLERGEPIEGSMMIFPPIARQILEAQDIVSILLLPVHIDRQWYGFIGFDALSHRPWAEQDIRLLRLAAERLGSYIERQRANEEIRTAHQRLLSIFDGLDAPVYVNDPNTYEVLYTNEATRQHFGNSGHLKCYELLHDRHEPCPFCPQDYLFGDRLGQSHVWEYQNEIDRRWYRCTNKVFQWPDGRFVHQSIAVDISDRKDAEDKLCRANQRLEEYTYTIGHDLKAPIRRIRYFSEFLIEDYESQLETCGRDYLNRILKATHEMMQAIDDLLVLSRIYHQNIEFKTTKINDIIDKIVKDLLQEKTDIEIVFDRLLEIDCQPVWMSLVFENLISNAIKYNNKKLKIVEINGRECEDFVEFSVKDNGLGIPQNCYDRVFELFRRVHLDLDVEGSGAGLAIVRSIVREHGGRVWIDRSEIDRGTTIKFTISKHLLDRRSLIE